MLVLLPRATGAGVVAPHLLTRHPGAFLRAIAAGLCLGLGLDGGGGWCLCRLSRWGFASFGDAGAVDDMSHIVLDSRQEALEHVMSLSLVGDEGVALGYGVQPYALAHMLHGGQVLHPETIYDAEHEQSLQNPHVIGADLFLFVLIEGLGIVDELVFDFLRPHLR